VLLEERVLYLSYNQEGGGTNPHTEKEKGRFFSHTWGGPLAFGWEPGIRMRRASRHNGSQLEESFTREKRKKLSARPKDNT